MIQKEKIEILEDGIKSIIMMLEVQAILSGDVLSKAGFNTVKKFAQLVAEKVK